MKMSTHAISGFCALFAFLWITPAEILAKDCSGPLRQVQHVYDTCHKLETRQSRDSCVEKAERKLDKLVDESGCEQEVSALHDEIEKKSQPPKRKIDPKLQEKFDELMKQAAEKQTPPVNIECLGHKAVIGKALSKKCFQGHSDMSKASKCITDMVENFKSKHKNCDDMFDNMAKVALVDLERRPREQEKEREEEKESEGE